jgi:hypothetical protein
MACKGLEHTWKPGGRAWLVSVAYQRSKGAMISPLHSSAYLQLRNGRLDSPESKFVGPGQFGEEVIHHADRLRMIYQLDAALVVSPELS